MFVSSQFSNAVVQQRPANSVPKFGTVVDVEPTRYIQDMTVYGEFDWEYRKGKTVPVKLYTDAMSVDQFKEYLDNSLKKFNQKHGSLPVVPDNGDFWLFLNADKDGDFEVGHHHWNPITLEENTANCFCVIRNNQKGFSHALDVIFRGLKALY